MSRRAVLRAGVGAAAAGTLVGSATARGSPATDEFEPLGFVEIEGTTEVAVSADGETAYVATRDGFATVDLADPTGPTVLAERRDLQADHEDGPLQLMNDVKVEGDRLVLSGPAFPGPPLQGMLLYDVTDPGDPVELAFHETDFPIHNAFVRDGYVYLTANDGERRSVVIVDARDDEPVEVAEWALTDHDERWADVHPDLRFVHDLWVQDGIAYVAHWDAGTWLVDVSDPTTPETITRFGPHDPEDLAALEGADVTAEFYALPGNDHYVTVDEEGAVLALGLEAWAVEEPGADDEENADLNGHDHGDGDDHGGGDGNGDDHEHDDGSDDGESPDDTGDPTAEDGLRGGPGGVELWDVSDPASPEKLSAIDPPETPDPTREGVWTTAHNCWFDDGLLYTSWYEGGVRVHDVSDPTEPVELAAWADPERASFWRAHGAVTGEFFVASSHDFEGDGFDQGLFTFPDVREADSGTPTAEGTPTETAATARQPGFGLGALAGFGLGAWWLSRWRRGG